MFFLDKPRTRYVFEPIEGCSFGCLYCNAFSGSSEINSFDEWRVPKIKKHTKKQIVNLFNGLKKDPPIMLDFVTVCSTSDPFQNSETEKVVFESLRVLHNDLCLNTRVLTKGFVPLWLKDFKNNSVGITIENLDRLNKATEKIKALKKLTDSGIYTYVSFQPFDLLIDIDTFKEMLETFKFVNKITFGILDTASKKNMKKALLYSNITADFCIDNKINYFNGSPRFNKFVKKELKKIGIERPIWFGDNISEELF